MINDLLNEANYYWNIKDGVLERIYNWHYKDLMIIPEGVIAIDFTKISLLGFYVGLVLPKSLKKIKLDKCPYLQTLYLWDDTKIEGTSDDFSNLSKIGIFNVNNNAYDLVKEFMFIFNQALIKPDLKEFKLYDQNNISEEEWEKIKVLLPKGVEAQKICFQDFLIENGDLIRYFGDDDEVVIPNEVKVIKEKAFQKKSFTSIVIPGGVGVNADAFAWFDINTLTIFDNVKCGLTSFINAKIEHLRVVNSGLVIELLQEIIKSSCLKKKALKELTIVGEPLTVKEMWKLFTLLGRNIVIHEQSKEDFDKEFDWEKDVLEEDTVSKLVKQIRSITSIMADTEKQKINAQVELLIADYNKGMEKLNPDLNLGQERGLILEVSPQNLKIKLIASLEMIIFNLASLKELKEFDEELDEYLEKPLIMPSAITTVEDKIMFIRMFGNSEIKSEFNKLIDTTKKGIKNNDYRVKESFLFEIDELFLVAQKYKLLRDIMSGELGDYVDYELAFWNDMNELRKVINALDENNRQIYINKLDNLYVSLDDFKNNSFQNVILIIRSKLMIILEELKVLVPKVEFLRDVIDEIDRSLEIMNGGLNEKDGGAIKDVVETILGEMPNSSVVKNYFEEKLKSFLVGWKDKILNNSYDSVINECLKIQDDNIRRWAVIYEKDCESLLANNLSGNSVVIEAILKGLYGIYFEILNYKDQKREFLQAQSL